MNLKDLSGKVLYTKSDKMCYYVALVRDKVLYYARWKPGENVTTYKSTDYELSWEYYIANINEDDFTINEMSKYKKECSFANRTFIRDLFND